MSTVLKCLCVIRISFEKCGENLPVFIFYSRVAIVLANVTSLLQQRLVAAGCMLHVLMHF
jgi:hypothetical protein